MTKRFNRMFFLCATVTTLAGCIDTEKKHVEGKFITPYSKIILNGRDGGEHTIITLTKGDDGTYICTGTGWLCDDKPTNTRVGLVPLQSIDGKKYERVSENAPKSYLAVLCRGSNDICTSLFFQHDHLVGLALRREFSESQFYQTIEQELCADRSDSCQAKVNSQLLEYGLISTTSTNGGWGSSLSFKFAPGFLDRIHMAMLRVSWHNLLQTPGYYRIEVLP